MRRTLWFAASREREFAEIISRKNSAETRREIRKRKIDLDTMRRRENELGSIFKRLYEDNVFGRIPDEQYRALSAGYTEEQRNLKERIYRRRRKSRGWRPLWRMWAGSSRGQSVIPKSMS